MQSGLKTGVWSTEYYLPFVEVAHYKLYQPTDKCN